jgi:glycosyltransferase 2 family protein
LARPPARVRSLKTGLIRAGQLVITVLVTWFILDRVGLDMDTLRAMDLSALRPNLMLLAAASALLLASYFFSAALWGRIVVDLGGPPIPLWVTIRLFMIANLGRYVPGKLWQIAGLAAMAKHQGIPAPTAVAAAVLGQGIALAAALTVGLGALLGGPEAYRQWGIPAAVIMAVGIGLAAVPAIFQRIVALWFRVARTDAPAELTSIHGLRWLVLYFVNWVAYALSFWLLLVSFGASAPLMPAASAFAAAYVLGYLFIMAPAGAGVREGFLIAFLTPHIGIASAGTIAVVARIWTTIVEVIPATVFWLWHVSADKAVADNE